MRRRRPRCLRNMEPTAVTTRELKAATEGRFWGVNLAFRSRGAGEIRLYHHSLSAAARGGNHNLRCGIISHPPKQECKQPFSNAWSRDLDCQGATGKREFMSPTNRLVSGCASKQQRIWIIPLAKGLVFCLSFGREFQTAAAHLEKFASGDIWNNIQRGQFRMALS